MTALRRIERLFAVTVSVTVPSILLTVVSMVMVHSGIGFMEYGVEIGMCGVLLGLVLLGVTAVVGVWS